MADDKYTSQAERFSNLSREGSDATPTGQKPSFGQKAKRHCAKWWWVHVLVWIAIILIVVLPIIYVGIPNIAQQQLNDSTLTVEAQAVTNPQPNSVELAINSTAHSKSSFHPTIEGFEGSLYLKDQPEKPFGILHIPETSVQSAVPINITQTLEITDMDAFIAYNKLIVTSETYSYGIKGKTVIHQQGLDGINVDYDKTVTQKGLNGFKGFELQDYNITIMPESDGTTLRGTAYIPNPSVSTLQLGNAVFNLTCEDQYIGQAFINDLVLRPGDNYYPTNAKTNQTLVVSILMNGKHGDFQLPINIIGDSITNSDGIKIDYLSEAMRASTISISLNASVAFNN
ncbi:hypothetical protein EJ05DRAFT_541354 [Pseudovirgaria hyperparasitica]|uniref:Uncharacterized protein n=1 Tax=Pseudovirgaria hyperparasitica TaxID=470096 RepID=A0A6A6VYA2_9PEZI|nr:uncharacterized protein EJ05DRAFT_541354 [Pseudovirgaria hyperparasitica]KAF2754267.1 hypothetical protein EJ05DRAFT_541354 [Pseudovirgaria hyperparasitica]